MSDIKARIVVDEDWKARVQRERQEVRSKSQAAEGARPDQQTARSPGKSESPGAAETTPPPESAGGEKAHPLFEALVGTLATQAMYCLGFMGAPGQNQVVVNLDQAKEAIDMILMLREKTKGNLAAQESAILNETLMELQRLFAARVQQAQAQTMQQAGVDPTNLRGGPQL